MKSDNVIFYEKPSFENSEIHTSDVKANFKGRSLFLLVFIVPMWVMFVLMLIDGAPLLWGELFFVILLLLTWMVVIKSRNDMKLRTGDLYFKVSSAGIEYSFMNEISGGVIQHCLLWSDIVTNPRRDCNSDIHLLYNGCKNSTINIVMYVSRQFGVVEEILIPVYQIRAFRRSWDIFRAILVKIALLPYPSLTIDEAVFYVLNIDPKTFRFRRKSIRRRLSNAFVAGVSLVISMLFAFGLFNIGYVLNINIDYLLPVCFVVAVVLSLFIAVGLVQYVRFFRNSYPRFSQVAYKKGSSLLVEEGICQVGKKQK